MNRLTKTMSRHSPPTVLFTVDVEDWFQVENFRPFIHLDSWSQKELRVERNVHRLLDLLEGCEATFFVLGWIADRLPGLVRHIADRGHEVASHGDNHCLNTALPIEALRQDLEDSKHRLEDIIGGPVVGYRAPSFAIDDTILKSIKSAGYRYDSSYNSFAFNSRYGKLVNINHAASRTIFEYDSGFYEIPLSNLSVGGVAVPWSGGGYFRLLPIEVYLAGIKYHLRRCHSYTFYIHPWEIDPSQPVVKEAGRVAKFRHYLNLDKTQHRVARLLQSLENCRFVSCRRLMKEYRANSQKILGSADATKPCEKIAIQGTRAISS
jgi:polysaccharide deacetylase family protein (PEP-CTERM system associated)